MKCLCKYEWGKLPRAVIPDGKGIMGAWMKLASHAAFRKGIGLYCGHNNAVEPGMWKGGIVGLKSILGVRRCRLALYRLNTLQDLGYIRYSLDPKNKKLTYSMNDWVVKCSGKPCEDGSVYATDGYGFLCVPRSITQRLAEQGYTFDELDAWLDLWCHTVFRDYGNAFSFLAPAVQYGKYGSVLTLETLGKRWDWEKTKVWRFFKKFEEHFTLYRLPGAFGCVICNLLYPSQTEIVRPPEEDVMRILDAIRISARNTHTVGTDNERINRFVAWKSRKVVKKLEEESAQNESGENAPSANGSEARVADLSTYTRAYFSHDGTDKYCRKCIYDCQGMFLGEPLFVVDSDIGPPYPFEDEFYEDDTAWEYPPDDIPFDKSSFENIPLEDFPFNDEIFREILFWEYAYDQDFNDYWEETDEIT